MKIFSKFLGAKKATAERHTIELPDISKHAVNVLNRLKKSNYEAYLVGGGVRDLLLGKTPKDFDIATNAEPKHIKKIFRNSELIGRRFQIVHIYFHNEIIEVATFRGTKKGKKRHYTKQGLLIKDNTYGTLEEDAERRDFTINALYYDTKDHLVLDHNHGLNDLKNRRLTIIGDPETRYREDPMRILRAIRLAAKLNFTISPDTAKPFSKMGSLLYQIPPARILDELLKIYRCGHSSRAIKLLKQYDLFEILFPIFPTEKENSQNESTKKMIDYIMENADKRIANEESLSGSFIFAALLWYPVQSRWQEKMKAQGNDFYFLNTAIQEILSNSLDYLKLPKKIKILVKEIWLLQYFFTKKKKRQIYYSLRHKRFRQAYHLLYFREKAGEPVGDLLKWWTSFQSSDKKKQEVLTKEKP